MQLIYRRCAPRSTIKCCSIFVERAVVGSKCCRRQHQYHNLLPVPLSRNVFIRSFASGRPLLDSEPNLHSNSESAEQKLAALENKVTQILQDPAIPSDECAQSILRSCEEYAQLVADAKKPTALLSHGGESPASSLLSLGEGQEGLGSLPSVDAQLVPSIRDKIAKQVSKMAYRIITDAKVFITPPILASYVSTQSLLGFPKTIPQAFILYANKRVPRPGTSPIQYKEPKPDGPSSAVPLAVADAGLSAAIETRDLPVCFDIINTSVCAPAFRRSKFIRRALLPITGFAMAPAAAYVLASQISTYQNTMDPTVATNIAFAGILAYIGFTTTIGFVAITTANDQMDRVTWVDGTPLRERWVREEERALIDRVSGAWGFKELSKRGEEEGKDWEILREWIGLRGMILDRVELMEGME